MKNALHYSYLLILDFSFLGYELHFHIQHHIILTHSIQTLSI